MAANPVNLGSKSERRASSPQRLASTMKEMSASIVGALDDEPGRAGLPERDLLLALIDR